MSESIYRFLNGRCPEHNREAIIRVSFTEVEDPYMGGVRYEKERCLCALANDEGCTDTNQCPMFVHAEAL